MLELNGLVEVVQTLEESTAHTLERCGVAWERLERAEAEERYPIRVPEGSFVVVQPEAGIVRADKALAAFAQGLDVREDSRVRPDELDADAVVVTAGPWVNELLDEPLPVKVTRETLAYFRLEEGRPIPSVVSFKPGRHTHEMYSLHDPEYGLKVGAHHAGPEADANVPGEPGAGADRADRGLGECDLPARRPRAGRRRDVHVHDHRGRELHPRAPRPRRRRLALLGPRLQVRAGDRRAARRPRDPGCLRRRLRRRPGGRAGFAGTAVQHTDLAAERRGSRLDTAQYPSAVPTYQVRGEVPRKRHIQFRDNGTLLTEEVMGLEGFSGNESILYHLTSPCRVTKVDEFEPIERDEWVPDGHQHRHFATMGLEAEGDAISGRRLLMWNQDVEISLCRPEAEMDYFFRNGEGDEVIFVHEGSGTLETIFGEVPYKEGDYVVVPARHDLPLPARGRPALPRLRVTRPDRDPAPLPQRVRAAARARALLPPRHPPADRAADAPRRAASSRSRCGSATATRPTSLDYHPFDVVGWDGYVYPWTFSIHDFEPITGRIHMPPPSHQTFEGRNFVICSFCPRKLDFDPLAIPIPYHHSNLNSEEMIYYVSGNFGSRRGIEVGSVTLHPSGIPHGPHPGLAEKSIGQTETHELAVMCDTFHPLRLTKLAKGLDDGQYAYSWLEERAPAAGDADEDPAGVTSHF